MDYREYQSLEDVALLQHCSLKLLIDQQDVTLKMQAATRDTVSASCVQIRAAPHHP